MTIPQNTIDAIRDRIDIAEIVAQTVELKRTGANLKGLCPFHQEKTPSFIVSPERQTFHCFGCGRGGNVFTFLMEMEGVTFPEAVRSLGEQCGVEVEDRRIPDSERSLNDRLYAANAFAARFYHQQLVEGAAGAAARSYLEGRGIPAEAWRRFGLGYAPDAWDKLWNESRRAGIPRETLLELHLIVSREKSSGYYDYFRNRLMFPIIRPGGRVVGFGARAFGDDEPKYLNSTESPVFLKRRLFYGVDRARDAIRSAREVLVVEGYTDVIGLHLAGRENSVAVCGTALSPDHATMLRRMTQNVLLVPDGDEAGQNAAVSSGAILLAAGLDVRVARLGPGEDPDTAARTRIPSEFADLLDGAVDYFGFLDYIIRKRELSTRAREALIRRVTGGLTGLDDPLRRDVILGHVARVFEVDAAGLRASTRGRGAARVADPPDPPGAVSRDPGRRSRERLALRLIMDGTPSAMEALDALDREDFSGDEHRKLYKLLDEARETRIDTRSTDFQRRAEKTGLEGLAAEIALISVPPGNVETLLTDTIRRIKREKIGDELTLLREKLLDLPPDSSEAIAVAEYYHKLKQALVDL
ncbi:MAG: DNA primase [Candidatus Krumholzibacteriota bacterium]|nr:DNA primase [Candidatus Krumholzibacteriota bacterium]